MHVGMHSVDFDAVWIAPVLQSACSCDSPFARVPLPDVSSFNQSFVAIDRVTLHNVCQVTDTMLAMQLRSCRHALFNSVGRQQHSSVGDLSPYRLPLP
jgi:hypothetical protein